MTEAEAKLIQKESSFNSKAKNPHSTAFGLWQGLESTRIKYGNRLGIKPDTTNPYEQVEMMRAYISDRYATAEVALNFHLAQGYY